MESSKGVPSNPISNLNEHIDLISELTIMDDGTREKEMEQLVRVSLSLDASLTYTRTSTSKLRRTEKRLSNY